MGAGNNCSQIKVELQNKPNKQQQKRQPTRGRKKKKKKSNANQPTKLGVSECAGEWVSEWGISRAGCARCGGVCAAGWGGCAERASGSVIMIVNNAWRLMVLGASADWRGSSGLRLHM